MFVVTVDNVEYTLINTNYDLFMAMMRSESRVSIKGVRGLLQSVQREARMATGPVSSPNWPRRCRTSLTRLSKRPEQTQFTTLKRPVRACKRAGNALERGIS